MQHFVRLNREALSDIHWWKAFVDRWNGVGLLSVLGKLPVEVCVQSNASGLWGAVQSGGTNGYSSNGYSSNGQTLLEISG